MDVEKIDVNSWQPLVVVAFYERLLELSLELSDEESTFESVDEKVNFIIKKMNAEGSMWKIVNVLLNCEWTVTVYLSLSPIYIFHTALCFTVLPRQRFVSFDDLVRYSNIEQRKIN